MKIKLLAEAWLQYKVKKEKEKVAKQEPNFFVNQKDQLWYRLMNVVDEEEQ